MLKHLIKDCGLTQKVVAEKIGISQQLVSRWIQGACQPQLEVIPKLAKVLNVSIEEIVNCFKEE